MMAAAASAVCNDYTKSRQWSFCNVEVRLAGAWKIRAAVIAVSGTASLVAQAMHWQRVILPKGAHMKRVITPLANVIRTVQDCAHSDAEAVAVLSVLLGSGRVAFARDVRPLLAPKDVAY
jgi:hypothetical protein